MLVPNPRDQEDGPWGDPFLLVRLWIHARKRINLICALKQDARVSEWKREFIPCGYSFTTYFVQISVARERSIKMNKTWFLLLRCSHLWRRQSWTQVTTVLCESREPRTKCWAPSYSRCPLWEHGWRTPGLEYGLFSDLTEGLHRWYRCTANEKSL